MIQRRAAVGIGLAAIALGVGLVVTASRRAGRQARLDHQLIETIQRADMDLDPVTLRVQPPAHQVARVEALLAGGANANADDGPPPPSWSRRMIDRILRRPPRSQYRSALELALSNHDRRDLAACLLRHGADPNVRLFGTGVGMNGRTPLMDAAEEGNLADCQLLLDAGADPNLRCGYQFNETAMFFAAAPSAPLPGSPPHAPPGQIISLLQSHGADINARDQYQRTPLLEVCATSGDQTAIIKTLIAHHADLHAHDGTDSTALTILAYHPDLTPRQRQQEIALLKAAGERQ